MEEEISIDGKSEIPTTHSFVYNDRQYPFNLDLFIIFSQYFNSNPPEEKNIDLVDENLKISESSIPDFINFCQAREITLSKENAPTLHKLSRKFKVPLLLNKTKKFISTHQKEVVVEILSMYQDDDIFDLKEYEEIISDDLLKYINDDRLLTLPIPILHRIIKKYLLKYQNQSNSNNSEQPSELIEFLFKCLDHFGRDASVLFDQIDSFGSKGNLINRLIDGYSGKFDFSFVNTGNLKTVYQLENEIIAREKEIKQQISVSKQEMIGMSQQLRDQIELMRAQREEELKDKKDTFSQIPKMVAKEIEVMKEKHEEELNNVREMLEKIPKIVVKEIEVMKKQHEEEMKKKDEMLENAIKKFEQMQAKHQEDLRMMNDALNEKMRKINDQTEYIIQPTITKLFDGNHNGIIQLLGDEVTVSSQKNDSSYIQPSYLKKYNNDVFNNQNGANAKSEPDSIIMFDFGQYKRIDLHSYFIRTYGGSPNCTHPKTWRIEGSNDCQSWTKLDRRENNGSLNGEFKECNFICQFSSYGSGSNLFRYIRYVQEESWNSSWKYIVRLTYFELFGNVITI